MRRNNRTARFFLAAGILFFLVAGHTPGQDGGPATPTSGPQVPAPQTPGAAGPSPAPQPPVAKYDPALFHNPIPSAELTFLNSFDGMPSGDLARDKQFGKLLRRVIPDCIFHYGWDMPLSQALQLVWEGSPAPVRIRNGRYLLMPGGSGPYLAGRGFLWMDLQDGIVLGGFYFHPTNGEPTPTLTVFSKQVNEQTLVMSQLPPAFAEDLWPWSQQSRIPPITTRYFITAANKKILLEHDEDYCAPVAGAPPPAQAICQQMNADAADIDLTAAYYLEQTNYATNGTAWMITNPEQVAWIQVRDNTCRIVPDPLGCRIVITRERIQVIIRRRRPWQPRHR
jgi:uncharacterized protein YecT (DUF1311 family)